MAHAVAEVRRVVRTPAYPVLVKKEIKHAGGKLETKLAARMSLLHGRKVGHQAHVGVADAVGCQEFAVVGEFF